MTPPKGLLTLLGIAVTVFICVGTADARKPEDARFVAAVRTWTQLSFVTSTTTIPTTCYTALNTQACGRRSMRKYRAMAFKEDVESQLDTSQLSEPLENVQNANGFSQVGDAADGSRAAKMYESEVADDGNTDDNKREGRIAVTVWSSTTSTYTMLMTSINTAETFSVSFYCSVVGANFPAMCG